MQKQRDLSTSYKRAMTSNKGVGAKFDSHCGSLKDDFKSVKGQLNAEQAKFVREMKYKLPAISISNQSTSKPGSRLPGDGNCQGGSPKLVPRAGPHRRLDKTSLAPLEREWNSSKRTEYSKSQSDVRSVCGYERDWQVSARGRSYTAIGTPDGRKATSLDPNNNLISIGMHGRSSSMGNIPAIVTENLQDISSSKNNSEPVKTSSKHLQETDDRGFCQAKSSSGSFKNENKEKQRDIDDKQNARRRTNSNEERSLPAKNSSLGISPKLLRRKALSTCTPPNRQQLIVGEDTKRTERKLSWNKPSIYPTMVQVEVLDLKQNSPAQRRISQSERRLSQQIADVKDLRYLRGGKFTVGQSSSDSSDGEASV